MARRGPRHRGALRAVRGPPPRGPPRRARGPATAPGLAPGARADRYDTIGVGYAAARREEPTWAEAIHAALAGCGRVVNVGAGTGNYEPPAADVVAIEPAMTMLAQRPPSRGPAVRAVAEALPLADDAFDAALAILTVHHWRDPAAGIDELARVARRQLVVTWDPEVSARFWLLRDYLPALRDHEAALPSLGFVEARLDVVTVTKLLVPRGCLDGFMGASWADPTRYLDPTVRASMSGVSLIDQRRVHDALAGLARDLDDGTWRRRNAELEALDAYDAGYRLVVAGASPGDSSRNRPTP